MTADSSIEQQLQDAGVGASYYTHAGELRAFPLEHRLAALRLMGLAPADEPLVPAMQVVAHGQARVSFRCHPVPDGPLDWTCDQESGGSSRGQIDGDALAVGAIDLADLPLGYHQLTLKSGQKTASGTVAVVPAQAWRPAVAVGDPKYSGIGCQLYTLVSERNWGIGDFTDLRALVAVAAERRMDFIALNPLHAPVLQAEAMASPYAPSDRRFLNPLYIDPLALAGASDLVLPVAEQAVRAKLRSLGHVDHEAVARLKFPVMFRVWQQWRNTEPAGETKGRASYNSFVESGGAALLGYAEHSANCQQLGGPGLDDPDFHLYLQWQAAAQLQGCQQLAKQAGMRLGLLGDLAVGAASDGAEVAGNSGLFVPGARIGAPPDPIAPDGQDWGLPAVNPMAMRRSGYRHFLDLLRANMHPYGALRIDHIMSLFRLWWCLPEAAGIYVHYPLDDLLGLICLESHRQQCLVIGEDMGVVPDEIRQAMARTGLLGNRLLYFETRDDGSFRWPEEHPENCILQVSNHDVPTLAGWWQGKDLHFRQALQGGVQDWEWAERDQRKQALLHWLAACGQAIDVPEQVGQPWSLELMASLLRVVRHSSAALLMVQLEDLQMIEDPVNVPGTWKEYPNWSRKLRTDAASHCGQAPVREMLDAMTEERQQWP